MRVRSFADFWLYYLGEHKSPTSRRLHFLGTSGWIASVAVSSALNPIFFPAAVAGLGLVGWHAVTRVEHERRSLPHVILMLALPTAASPIVFPAGVVFAYGCAWVGHFGYEKNRPATFHYPVWSLACDLRMWSHMVRGRLWSGADPAAQVAASSTPNQFPSGSVQ